MNVWVPGPDVERLTELGLKPKEFAVAAVKQALAELEQHRAEALAETMRPSPFLHLPPLTDEENQLLEESVGVDAAQFETMAAGAANAEPTPEFDDWIARLKARAAAE